MVDDAAYSADGQRLLSIGGPDGDMHLWDTAECSSGDLWPTLSSGESIGQSYTAVAISQMRVAAGDTQGTVSVQAFDPAFQMQAALSRVYKNTRITTDEKARGVFAVACGVVVSLLQTMLLQLLLDVGCRC